MKKFHSLTFIALTSAMLTVSGLQGIAQSQFYDPFYSNPYYYSYYGPSYGYPYYGPYGGYSGYGAYGYDYIPTDDELRAQIRNDLFTSPFVDGEQIRVSVEDRVVTLSGRVEDRSAMVDAVEIAYDAGAYKVRNHLRQREGENRPWAEMSDRELKHEIEDELAFSPFVDEEQIRVNVRDGVAILYGGVENEGEIADAVENAYEAGARRVESELWVDPELSDLY